MDGVYRVPLIAPDLRQEENILQIADLLQHLNGVVADVFGRINARIEQNVTRTRLFAARIEACGRQVDRLTDTNKSTRVCCAAKYPASPSHHFPALFPPTAAHAQGGPARPLRDIKCKASLCNDKELQDKLEFYHVKLSCPSPLQVLLEGAGERGRGAVPPQLGALGGLLLRGPQETAYSSAGGPRAPTVPASLEPPPGLHAAPATVAQRDHHAAQHDYLYSPSTGEVPSLDVPQDLPHLAGVAGDLRFHAGAGPAIAPSVLPRTEEPLPAPTPQAPVAPQAAPPPPPPPPPPLPDVEFEETDSKGQNATLPKAEPPVQRPLAPPAPPPPPPIAPRQSPPSAPRQPPALDSRASLMDAIRKAGGSGKASLRSTTSKEQAAPTAASGGGGDLMADLHARLSMRRKGISGGAGGTILAAISAIVPPPAEHDTPSNSELSSAEDDWD